MHVLTLIAPDHLDATLVDRIGRAIGGGPPVWLAPGRAADIPCDPAPAQATIAELLAGAKVDAVVQLAAQRRRRLLVADMDSTMVTTETLDELAAYAGLQDRVAAITSRSMNGEVPFEAALLERVAMLRGLGLPALEATWQRTAMMPGAAELVATMNAHGGVCALVSGGFTFFTSRVAARLGFAQHHANILLDDGTALTGELQPPIVDRSAKRRILLELAAAHAIPIEATLAVGDGANDLDMLRAAGLGVAYHAKPIVAREARAAIIFTDLRSLLFLQGYTSDAFA